MRLSKKGSSFLSSSISKTFCIPVVGLAMLIFMAEGKEFCEQEAGSFEIDDDKKLL